MVDLLVHHADMHGSNHGGRNLDTSPPALLVLLELRKHFPEAFSKMEIYVDGGIRRGTDILKAYCLGATAVLLGRPFLYSLAYGEDGVERLIDSKYTLIPPLQLLLNKCSSFEPYQLISISPTRRGRDRNATTGSHESCSTSPRYDQHSGY